MALKLKSDTLLPMSGFFWILSDFGMIYRNTAQSLVNCTYSVIPKSETTFKTVIFSFKDGN